MFERVFTLPEQILCNGFPGKPAAEQLQFAVILRTRERETDHVFVTF